MSELDDIRAFVEVLELGGFGRAAKQLGVSKSIVSRRISRLEVRAWHQASQPDDPGISPTEAGLEFKARTERILVDLEEARETVANRAGEVVGRLRISLPVAFGLRHVAPLLNGLMRLHPKLEIEASYTDRFVDLVGERLDAAIRIGELKDLTLIARRFASGHSAIVASPAYLARHGRPETPEDLGNHECRLYRQQ